MGSDASACASLTVIIDRVLPLLILSVGLMASSLTMAKPLSGVGRFKTLSSSCHYTLLGGHQGPCGLVELTRRGPSVISLRFTGSGPEDDIHHELTFVVIAEARSIPLHCEGGRCRLKAANWNGNVSSASEGITDPIGLAIGVPKAWPAHGRCDLREGRLQCEARLLDGATLRAVAEL